MALAPGPLGGSNIVIDHLVDPEDDRLSETPWTPSSYPHKTLGGSFHSVSFNKNRNIHHLDRMDGKMQSKWDGGSAGKNG